MSHKHPIYESDKVYHTIATTNRGKSSIMHMIQKLYPDYTGEKPVLWLDLSLFTGTYSQHIVADVEFMDSTNTVIRAESTNHKTKRKGKQILIRTPFINKNIFQVGAKLGRKRTYGIPIVFESIDDLLKIHMVRITWTAYGQQRTLHANKSTMDISQFVCDFTLDIHRPTAPGQHWYTLRSKNGPETYILNHSISEFAANDIMCGYQGSLEIDHNLHMVTDHVTSTDPDLYQYHPANKLFIDDSTKKEALTIFRAIPWDADEITKLLEEESNSIQQNIVLYSRRYCRGTVSLYGKEIADIMCTPDFGFTM